jgi:hypothetical protein
MIELIFVLIFSVKKQPEKLDINNTKNTIKFIDSVIKTRPRYETANKE